MKPQKIELSAAQIKDLVARGIIAAPPVPKKAAKVELVEEAFTAPPDGQAGPLAFMVPLKTVSETNERGQWHKKAHRTGNTRRIVSRVLGKRLRYLVPFAEAFHAGRVVCVTLTRYGGQGLDRLANLGAALKAVEDAVAIMLGADDGAGNWKAVPEQKPGGPYGVLIELALL